MASPTKPWERPGVNRQSDEGPMSSYMSSGPNLDSTMSCCEGGGPSVGGGDVAPPPVPSRPGQYGGYGGMGSSMGAGMGGYSNYGSSYGGMGGYSSMYGGGMNSSMYGGGYGSSMYGGGYGSGMGYNRYGAQNTNDYNSFSRLAEESSRPAFQSIESIVGAFSSISMMLDSTFQAVYNSFRAVVGVADNFSRMKMQFAQIFSAFAVFRTLRYLYRKLLVLLRLRPQGFAEDAWTEAGDTVAQTAATAGGPASKKSTWPVLMFFGIIMGGPWLIWKFLQSACSNQMGPGWATGIEDHFVARATYDFQGQGNEELSFKAGTNINVAPKEIQPRMKGWLLASVDGKTVGIIPVNYVKILGKRRGNSSAGNPMQNPGQIVNEQSESFPNESLPPQTGSMPSNPGPTQQSFGQTPSPGLVQSPSALNFETDMQRGYNNVNPTGEMDTMFNEATSPLDSVPELPMRSEEDKCCDKT